MAVPSARLWAPLDKAPASKMTLCTSYHVCKVVYFWVYLKRLLAVTLHVQPVLPIKGSGRYERQTQQDARLKQLGGDVLGTVKTGFVTASANPAAAGPSSAPGAPPPPPPPVQPPVPTARPAPEQQQRHRSHHHQSQHRSGGGSGRWVQSVDRVQYGGTGACKWPHTWWQCRVFGAFVRVDAACPHVYAPSGAILWPLSQAAELGAPS